MGMLRQWKELATLLKKSRYWFRGKDDMRNKKQWLCMKTSSVQSMLFEMLKIY